MVTPTLREVSKDGAHLGMKDGPAGIRTLPNDGQTLNRALMEQVAYA